MLLSGIEYKDHTYWNVRVLRISELRKSSVGLQYLVIYCNRIACFCCRYK